MADDIIRAGVIGDPIKHSRSPIIHGYWLRQLSIAGRYDTIHVPAGTAAAFFSSMIESGLAGCNVTVPHKEAALAVMDELTDTARSIGAVNTVWTENGKLIGDNTDSYGYAANLDQRAPGWDRGGKATVIGAGGAARAIVYALLERGFDRVAIVNRTLGRAEQLANHFGPRVSAHPFDVLSAEMKDATLVVNTTTLGMEGKDGYTFDLSSVPEDALVSDIVYTPLVTPLLAAAKERGLRTADGLGMLLHQAVPGFERWFGARPKVSGELRALVLATMGVVEEA